jgi:hypothetical protein
MEADRSWCRATYEAVAGSLMATAPRGGRRELSERPSEVGNPLAVCHSAVGATGAGFHRIGCIVAPPIGLVIGLCLLVSAPGALANVVTTSTADGPLLSSPELVAAAPFGEVMGVGSDGADGVWFAEDTNPQ